MTLEGNVVLSSSSNLNKYSVQTRFWRARPSATAERSALLSTECLGGTTAGETDNAWAQGACKVGGAYKEGYSVEMSTIAESREYKARLGLTLSVHRTECTYYSYLMQN